MMTAPELRKLAYVLANINKHQLEEGDVVKKDQVGGSDWNRFTDDPVMFIIKLPDDRLEKLMDLINSMMK